ncbi:hypothetical protein Lal_00004637 [Lupinus albus]|nr:hypothetical protein Lal_00004637 [Lupinus albus]
MVNTTTTTIIILFVSSDLLRSLSCLDRYYYNNVTNEYTCEIPQPIPLKPFPFQILTTTTVHSSLTQIFNETRENITEVTRRLSKQT